MFGTNCLGCSLIYQSGCSVRVTGIRPGRSQIRTSPVVVAYVGYGTRNTGGRFKSVRDVGPGKRRGVVRTKNVTLTTSRPGNPQTSNPAVCEEISPDRAFKSLATIRYRTPAARQVLPRATLETIQEVLKPVDRHRGRGVTTVDAHHRLRSTPRTYSSPICASK